MENMVRPKCLEAGIGLECYVCMCGGEERKRESRPHAPVIYGFQTIPTNV